MPLDTAPVADATAAYAGKSERYFGCARVDFVTALPDGMPSAVLEVGCGTGATGALALARGKARRYVGIELMPGPAAEARRVLTEVVVGDVERLALPWEAESFDALIMSEVLEHLCDPWSTLERLGRLVHPGGLLLASSPNIAHWKVIRELLAGRFELADQGVFDRTHMRWFTPSTYRALVEGAGFTVERIGPVASPGPRARLLSRLSIGRLDHLLMTQTCIHARKR